MSPIPDPADHRQELAEAMRRTPEDTGTAGAAVPRAHEFFTLAAEAARAQFDPRGQWDDFVLALWYQVDAGFGLTDGAGERAD